MSDISVNEADLVVLLQELENRGIFKTVIITNANGVQELKAIVPVGTVTINTPQEEEWFIYLDVGKLITLKLQQVSLT